MISEEQLAAWEHLANEATEGPWYVAEGSIIDNDFPIHKPVLAHYTCENDAAFIAAAREAVPALIAEIRELRAELAKEREYADDNCMIGVFHGTSMAHDKIRQLEREAAWLARRISITGICAKPKSNAKNKNCGGDECAECWRDAARNAVNSSTNC